MRIWIVPLDGKIKLTGVKVGTVEETIVLLTRVLLPSYTLTVCVALPEATTTLHWAMPFLPYNPRGIVTALLARTLEAPAESQVREALPVSGVLESTEIVSVPIVQPALPFSKPPFQGSRRF
jgi:hypothetical protein